MYIYHFHSLENLYNIVSCKPIKNPNTKPLLFADHGNIGTLKHCTLNKTNMSISKRIHRSQKSKKNSCTYAPEYCINFNKHNMNKGRPKVCAQRLMCDCWGFVAFTLQIYHLL